MYTLASTTHLNIVVGYEYNENAEDKQVNDGQNRFQQIMAGHGGMCSITKVIVGSQQRMLLMENSDIFHRKPTA